MPYMDGSQFVEMLKQSMQFRDIPVILLAQYNNNFFTKKDEDKFELFDSIIHKADISKSLMIEIKKLL